MSPGDSKNKRTSFVIRFITHEPTMHQGNLFHNLPDSRSAEVFEELLRGGTFRVERIVSGGQATPQGQWYDQSWHEWVVLLQGAAGLRLEHEPEPKVLRSGDHLLIPAGCRHRVEWTSAEGETVWLAIHFSEQADGEIGPSQS